MSISGRWSSPAEIHAALLKETPVGSSLQEVTAFINNRLAHKGGRIHSLKLPGVVNFNLLPTNAKKNAQVPYAHSFIPDLSSKSREEILFRITLNYYQGIPFKVLVLADWHFSKDGLLEKITVEKEYDGL